MVPLLTRCWRGGGSRGVGVQWCGPGGGGPRRVGSPEFRVFSLSRHNFLSFFPLLGVFSWSGCLMRRGLEMLTFGVLGLSCEASAAPKPLGFHTTTREPKRADLRVPSFKNTTKIPREDPQRVKKRTNFAVGEGKKERNFGRSRGSAVLGRAVGGERRSRGTEHDQTKTLKPTPTRETPLHETVTPHTLTTHTTADADFGQADSGQP